MKKSVEVLVAGLKLNIHTAGDPDHVREAAALVQQQFKTLKHSGAIIDTTKIMTLIALNLADELLSKERPDSARMNELIADLDQVVAQAEGLANVSLR